MGDTVEVLIVPDDGYKWEGDITIHDSNYILYVEDDEALDENGQFVMPADLSSPDFDYVYIGAICVADVANNVDNTDVEHTAVKTVQDDRIIIRRANKTYTIIGIAL